MILNLFSLLINSFRMPSLKLLDKDMLLQFLGPDLNSQLSATTRPTTNPPRACDLLATTVGSGGEFIYTVLPRNYAPPFCRLGLATSMGGWGLIIEYG